MSINPIILSIPIYFILIVTEWTVDLFLKKGRYRFSDAIANIGCGLTEQLSGLFIQIGVIAIYTYIYELWRITDIPHTWYWGIILFILVDFCYYWAHRKSHEINLFWIGHVVHHQSEDYNLSVALRQGSLQKIFTAPFFWPLAIVGFDPLWFLFIGAFVTLYQFWIHTEYIDKMGWFEYIFNSPSHHRVHHGKNPEYIDKNHGGTLIIWDRMFGTFQAETTTPNYGVTEQLKTFNPINATLIPVQQLWNKFTSNTTAINKTKSLFLSPGWSLNKTTSPSVDMSKYDTPVSVKTIVYVAIIFMQLLGFTSYILFNYASFSTPVVALLVGLALSTLWSLGNLLDRKKFAILIETIRVVLVSSMLFLTITTASFLALSIEIIGGYSIISMSLLWLIYPSKK